MSLIKNCFRATGKTFELVPFSSRTNGTPLVAVIRNSSYGPHFIEPLHRRQDIQALKERNEDHKLKHIPIKAARSEQTSSQFFDPVVEKFVNYVMRCGEKQLARDLVNKTFEKVKRIQITKYNNESDLEKKKDIELNALLIFHKALENCKPVLQLTPVKRGGQTYQVPIAISDKKASFIAMNWLIEQGKADSRTTRFYDKLAHELVLASKNQGKVIKRKQDLHKQCEANRAYAHYRWS